MRVLTALLLSSLAAAGIGCADECTTAGDCKASERCVEGACAPLPAPPILLPYDGGPDSGIHPDAANSDPPRPDAAPDAEVDGGPGPGPGDGGDAGDVGPGPGLAERSALVEIATIVTSSLPNGDRHATARFLAYDPPGVVTEYMAPNVACRLTDRRGTSGSGNGFGGMGIRVSGFTGGPGTPPFVIEPATAPSAYGLYQSRTFPVVPWVAGQTITYAVLPSGTNGHITTADAMLSGDLPPSMATMPVLTTPLALAAGNLTLTWTVVGEPTLAVVAELYDTRQLIRLRCVTTNRGTITLPQGALTDFRARAAGSFRLDLAYERSIGANVPVVGGGSIPTTFRHLSGVRYVAQ